MSDTGYFEGRAVDAGARELRFVARYEVDDTVEVFWRARLFAPDGRALGDRHGAFIAFSVESLTLQGEIGDRVRRIVSRDFRVPVATDAPPDAVSARSPPRAAPRSR